MLAVAACEVAVRRVGPALSGDMRHIQTFPAIARKLDNSRRLRILFLGNSLTRTNTDVNAFQSELERSAVDPPACAVISPDDTVLSDWYYIFKNVFSVRQQAPDVVVIGFRRNRQVCDSGMPHARKLGRDFCNLGDTAEVFEHELAGLAERTAYLLSSFCAVYAYQERIKHRILDRVIPDFRPGMRKINAIITESQGVREAQASQMPRLTYRRLRRFMAMLKRSGTRGVFVAMPLGDWPLDAAIPEMVREAGMTFVDCRRTALPALTGDYAPDGFHLGKAGARIYSRFLAKKLAGELKKQSEQRHRALHARQTKSPSE